MRIQEIGRLALVILITISTRSSASGQVSPPSKPASPAPLRDLFQELDTNGDRVISVDEIPARGQAAFQTLLRYGDRDHDGKLAAEEFRDLMQRVGQNRAALATPAQLKRRFAMLDANKDGKLDGKELPGGPARLQRLDRDGDGFVSREEFLAMNQNRAGARPNPAADPAAAGPLQRRLKAMDKNGDQRISRDEFTGIPARFDRLDTNHDGFLDSADRPGPAAQPGEAKGKPKS
jgi:Ca2+-binding EF-hand superfamily protein